MKIRARPAFFALCIFLFLLFLLRSDAVSKAVEAAAYTVAKSLFPSIFFFLFFGCFLSELCIAQRPPKIARLIFRKLFSLNERAFYPWLIGLLCGFPSGALAIERAVSSGDLTRDEGRHLLLFVNNPSPAFCISLIGFRLCGSAVIGLCVFLACALASTVFAILARRSVNTSENSCSIRSNTSEKGIFQCLLDAVERAVFAFVKIGVLYIAMQVLFLYPSHLLASRFSELCATCVYALLDAAGACMKLSGLSCEKTALFATVSLSFQGVLIYLQSFSAHRLCGLNAIRFWGYRAFLCAISCIFLAFFLKIGTLLCFFTL